MGLIDRLRSAVFPPPSPNIDNFWPYVNMDGGVYPITLNQTLLGKTEPPAPGYDGLVAWAYRSNAIVFACMRARASLFTEARFKYRQVRVTGPGDLFGGPGLAVLETPWPNGTTGDLLGRMIQDADLAGNSFTLRRGDSLVRLRPDWVTIVSGSNSDSSVGLWDVDAKVLGYGYTPGGPQGGRKPEFYQVSEVAHFAPITDPLAPYRGMSWLTPIMREIGADTAMTDHKSAFLTNGATPNLVVSLDPNISKAQFDTWTEAFKVGHEGLRNAYKTLYLGGGAKVEVVGKDLQQMDFKTVQGAGETRIAAAAGVPPIVVGLSEGLAAATYSNYGQARRAFADLTMRTLWRNACASLATIVPAPGRAELWYDDRDISFLQEDVTDQATVQQIQANAIRSLIDAGFEAKSVIDAITANDMARLQHTGLFSVQLQAPGSTKMPQGEAPGELPVGDQPVGKVAPAAGTSTSTPPAKGNGSMPMPMPKGMNSARDLFADLLEVTSHE